MENQTYLFYKEIIKPLEKKYNKMCTLYNILGFKSLKTKRNYYNILLKEYYESVFNKYYK